ncbi:hypothetical protein [Sporosarcina sp. A2]|uniref:hypothetical protein n=1 Tax=Sporosarcina sp. A2 TaxID=3393449 RepID=UPI003D7BD47E
MRVIVYNSFAIIGVTISLAIATVLGTYGQGISYFLNERNPSIELTTAITIVTFLSIGLYITNPILLIKFLKLKNVYLIACVIVSVLIGLLISMFSFFVWAMWMG